MKHIGKIVLAHDEPVPVMYDELAESRISTMSNIDAVGYQVLNTIAHEKRTAILELGSGKKVTFRIVKGIGDIFQNKLVCTAEVLSTGQTAGGLDKDVVQ